MEADEKYLWLQLVDIKEKSIVYIPEGRYESVIPAGESARGFEPGRIENEFTFSACVATRVVVWVRLKELVFGRWDNFASLNQIKIMGRDI